LRNTLNFPYKNGFIQIAGILDRGEADLLTAAGVDLLGFPFGLDVHAEDISEKAAKQIIRTLKPPVAGVLITYLNRAEKILALCRKLGLQWVQLHAPIPLDELKILNRLAPETVIIKSLVIRHDNRSLLEKDLYEHSPYVDAFITDTYDPETGASGATGKTHDWEVSHRLVELSSRPVILAGGLNPGNVQKAIRQVRPAGVDAHTGVETPDGRKDANLLRTFIDQARKGFEAVHRD